jgi:ribosome-associated heat shock protein Hsp15
VRVNGTRASKPATSVGPGDVLTFAQARAIRVIRIVGLGTCGAGPRPKRRRSTTISILQVTPPRPEPGAPARVRRRRRGVLDDLRDPEA